MQIFPLNSEFSKDVIRLIRASDKEFSWSDQQILESLINDLSFGLFDEEKLLAMTIFSRVFETAELLYVCVDKFQQNKGFGYSILNDSFGRLFTNEVLEVFLEVNTNNQKAINLYHKLGFKDISVRKKYYKNLDGSFSDALICKLNKPD